MSGGSGVWANNAVVSLVAQFGVGDGFGVTDDAALGCALAPEDFDEPFPAPPAVCAGCGFGDAVDGAEERGDGVTGGVGGGGVGCRLSRKARTC